MPDLVLFSSLMALFASTAVLILVLTVAIATDDRRKVNR